MRTQYYYLWLLGALLFTWVGIVNLGVDFSWLMLVPLASLAWPVYRVNTYGFNEVEKRGWDGLLRVLIIVFLISVFLIPLVANLITFKFGYFLALKKANNLMLWSQLVQGIGAWILFTRVIRYPQHRKYHPVNYWSSLLVGSFVLLGGFAMGWSSQLKLNILFPGKLFNWEQLLMNLEVAVFGAFLVQNLFPMLKKGKPVDSGQAADIILNGPLTEAAHRVKGFAETGNYDLFDAVLERHLREPGGLGHLGYQVDNSLQSLYLYAHFGLQKVHEKEDELLRQWPDLFCKVCHLRPVLRPFGLRDVPVCPKCDCHLHFAAGVKNVVAYFAPAPTNELETTGNEIRISVWDEASKTAFIAEADELLIESNPGISMDWAIAGFVGKWMENQYLTDKKLTITLAGPSDLEENTFRLLRSIAKNPEILN